MLLQLLPSRMVGQIYLYVEDLANPELYISYMATAS